jgi:hypothetical protein
LAASDFGGKVPGSALQSQLFAPLVEGFGNVECTLDSEREGGRNYHDGVCCKIHARTPDGRMLELVDGGSVDWTRKLLSNSKERLVTSGIGSERVCTAFGN